LQAFWLSLFGAARFEMVEVEEERLLVDRLVGCYRRCLSFLDSRQTAFVNILCLGLPCPCLIYLQYFFFAEIDDEGVGLDADDLFVMEQFEGGQECKPKRGPDEALIEWQQAEQGQDVEFS
jgi:hypothetical protein